MELLSGGAPGGGSTFAVAVGEKKKKSFCTPRSPAHVSSRVFVVCSYPKLVANKSTFFAVSDVLQKERHLAEKTPSWTDRCKCSNVAQCVGDCAKTNCPRRLEAVSSRSAVMHGVSKNIPPPPQPLYTREGFSLHSEPTSLIRVSATVDPDAVASPRGPSPSDPVGGPPRRTTRSAEI